LPGSPAIDAGTSGTGIPATDQRGDRRVGNVDIGAFESQGFTLAYVAGENQAALPGTAFQPLQATLTANNPVEPIAGGVVCFTVNAGSNGAAAVLGTNPVVLDSTGQISMPATANSTPGRFTVTASTRGAASSILYLLTSQPTPMISVTDNGGMYNGLCQGVTDACVLGANGVVLASLGDPSLSFTYYDYPGPDIFGSTIPPCSPGTYSVVAQWTSNNPDYTDATSVPMPFTITPALLIITANDATKVYGTANPTFTASYAGFVNGDTPSSLFGSLSLSTQAATSSDVGNYSIVPSCPASFNYDIHFVNGNLSITPASQTITWYNPLSIQYGTPLSIIQLDASVSVVGPAPAGALSYNVAAGTYLSAGIYTLAVTAAATLDYSAAVYRVPLIVVQAPLSVTANNATMVYGSANPSFSASYSGFVSDDGPSSLGGALSFSTAATTSSDVGNYAITPGGLTSSDYAIKFVNGNLCITQASQTITWSNPADIVYGTPLSGTQLDAVVSVVGPAAAGAVSYTPAAGSVLLAGSNQPLTVNVAATTDYTSASATVHLNVKTATLTITPLAGQSMLQGDTVPKLNFTASGFVNGDGPSLLTGSLGTTATSSSPIGNYAFTLGTLSAGSNYTLVLASPSPTFAVTSPNVVSTRIDDGTAQRSMVRSLTLTFASSIASSLATVMASLSLTRTDGLCVGLCGTLDSTGTVLTLTFTGSSIFGGSLADGRYNLCYNGSTLLAAGTKGQTGAGLLWRLFGDVGGTACVNAADKTAFMAAMNSRRGQSNYCAYFDYDENGVIIINDLTQFYLRCGTSI
jgi:hypothetical protein